ncbi:MAG TPA: tetrahydromethanopterin S-methyltransferase subunit A [Methanothrix sp.]|nr:tetrahydromethanopterin S-methyltransferase subunit A [Methanothrix sp.]HOV82365.1 tetrahydromethanopterin S-methyltransferase subunit A [Methanothrix sp.]HPC88786.1 tetrahydromethanopterin S-methyltransferase subunit A [Methanothrix sp.]HQE87074.1 tetrahydromethanopterin S-methyltransferase subunit A [Methanothrix sp.]HQI67458.1 tetrahydromethanopterin S-methyltransferase subunit A [Methanothrix sp.]
MQNDNDSWPPVRGDYRVGDAAGSVAVVTLASRIFPEGSAICGPCKTENLGIEKIVANVISNCNIRFIIICGAESRGHLPGDTILALHKNGIDEQGRIIGSRGAIPFIQNLPREAILRFQDQVQIIDRTGLDDIAQIEEQICKYSLLGEQLGPYPAEPIYIVKRKARAKEVCSGSGDLSLGCGTVMDASAWLVMQEV